MKNVKKVQKDFDKTQDLCVFLLFKNGLRISEIFYKNSEHSCLLQLKDNNGQLNKQSLCLSCQSAINTLKHTQTSEKKLTPNGFRHAYATKLFLDNLNNKNTLGHQNTNMTSKYIENQ